MTDIHITGAHPIFTGLSPPCCGSCFVYIGSAELMFWPSSTSQPGITSFVDTDGFTLYVFPSRKSLWADTPSSLHPSLYVAFSSISAEDFCTGVGSMILNTTFSFRPDELSTIKGNLENCPFTCDEEIVPLTVADLGGSCLTKPRETRDIYMTYDHCRPYLVLPPSFSEKIDRPWSTCSFITFSIWDPPRALTPVAPHDATITPSGHRSETTAAVPGLKPSAPAISTVGVYTGEPPLASGSSKVKPNSVGSFEFDPGDKSVGTGDINQALKMASTNMIRTTDLPVPVNPSIQDPDISRLPDSEHTAKFLHLESPVHTHSTANAVSSTSSPSIQSFNNPAAKPNTAAAEGTHPRPLRTL